MILEVKIKDFVLLIAFLATSLFVNAQSLEDAQKAYNAGVTAKTDGNIVEAIAQFTSCVEMCETLYEEEEDETAEELMYTVQSYIPGLYLKLGTDQVQNKQVQEGLANLYKCREISESFGDSDTKAKAEKFITQIHYKLGASKYKAGDFETAHVQLDKALEITPNYVSAYYLKSVLYKKQGDDAMLKSTAMKGIEIADAKNDIKYKDKIVKLAKGYFLKKGNDAKGASKYDEAIENLNIALEFVPTDVTTLYLISATYLAQGKYSNAVKTGESAVQNEKGGAEAQAKIYMIIAEAHAKNGNTTVACSTYKKAAAGQYAELANYRIQHELKCE